MTVERDGEVSLPPEACQLAGLVTGDILSLELVTSECLSLEIYHEVLGRWDAMDRGNLWRFIAEFLSRPLVAVEPETLQIPAGVFPLPAGARVILHVSDVHGFWHVLWLSRR